MFLRTHRGEAQKKFLLRQEYWKGLTRGIQETHRKVALTAARFDKQPKDFFRGDGGRFRS